MADEQHQAEQLDDDVLTDDVTDDRSGEEPATGEDYPPDHPAGVDDPNRYFIEDDLATRVDREQPDDEVRPG